MRAERPRRPPRLAAFLVRCRLPAELADAVVGDLHEEYALRVAPARGAWSADLWYWGQALALRA
ncbi:MAG TPA: permease prefix domain 2-containing transporter, partial [Longimicrobiales bacterium]|nr:permease prefix domain 2-containing transporter [Longimicrobiales bacterium]